MSNGPSTIDGSLKYFIREWMNILVYELHQKCSSGESDGCQLGLLYFGRFLHTPEHTCQKNIFEMPLKPDTDRGIWFSVVWGRGGGMRLGGMWWGGGSRSRLEVLGGGGVGVGFMFVETFLARDRPSYPTKKGCSSKSPNLTYEVEQGRKNQTLWKLSLTL